MRIFIADFCCHSGQKITCKIARMGDKNLIQNLQTQEANESENHVSLAKSRCTYVWGRLALHKRSSSRGVESARLDIGEVADGQHTSDEPLLRRPPGLDLAHTRRSATRQVLAQSEIRLSGR